MKEEIMDFLVRDIKILVIDDQYNKFKPDLEIRLRGKKERRNWNIIYAETVEDGKKQIKSEKPDVVILDLLFSENETSKENSGKKILEYIKREVPYYLPVIIYSSVKDVNEIARYVSSWGLGADAYFSKNNPDFLGQIQDLICRLVYENGLFSNKLGFIITHGTDTMAYGFSFLRYMLKKIPANIVLTGSQIPLEGFFSPSDAIGNLKTGLIALRDIRAPGIFVVFSRGKKIFHRSLTKVKKWNTDAFEGNIFVESEWWDSSFEKEKRFIALHKRKKIEYLVLIRTGGTIESKKDEKTGLLKATGDYVQGYLSLNLNSFFNRIDTTAESLGKDSSNLIFEDWKNIGESIVNILDEYGKHEEKKFWLIDSKFNLNVRPILLSPFFTKQDYESMIKKLDGGVILGYGAGNGNISSDTHNILQPIEEFTKQGKFFVISSLVPIDKYDFEYETGWKLIEKGGIPAPSLSFEEALVRLSYVLGHKNIIDKKAKKLKIEPRVLLTALYLSGLHFRTNESRRRYIKYMFNGKDILLAEDVLTSPFLTFEEALEEQIKLFKSKWTV